MTANSTPTSLARDTSGIAAVELGLLMLPMTLMLMGFFDLAHQTYTKAVLQGAVQKAARDATLEGGGVAGAALDAAIVTKVESVTGTAATFVAERLSYTNFNGVGTPENFTDVGTPGNNQYDVGECFEDVNGNGQWDSDIGRNGQGGAQDAVLYRMTVTYPRLFPMTSLLGWSANETVAAETVLRNQPYAEQVVPVVAGCP